MQTRSVSEVYRKWAVLIALAALVSVVGPSATRGDAVQYVGGTLGVDDKTKGKMDLSGTDLVTFEYKGGSVKIPYKGIKSIEYGQKAGRRVGMAVAVSPVLLFSKKRKHFVSLTFTDSNGAEQGAVFEFGKKTVRNALTLMGTRSGVTIEFESEDAKKNLP